VNVHVIYNGVRATLDASVPIYVGGLLGMAIKRFHPVHKAELLAFFAADGRELNRQHTIEEAGIHDGEELLLRTTVVK
jgi:hypothetical protein